MMTILLIFNALLTFSPEQLHAVIESIRCLTDEQIAHVDLPGSAA